MADDTPLDSPLEPADGTTPSADPVEGALTPVSKKTYATVVDLDLAMHHLRAYEEDRALVSFYLSAAEHKAMQFLQRRFYADVETMRAAVLEGTAGDNPILINPDIMAGVLLIAGHLHLNREDVITGISANEIPQGSETFLFPYRVKMGF